MIMNNYEMIIKNREINSQTAYIAIFIPKILNSIKNILNKYKSNSFNFEINNIEYTNEDVNEYTVDLLSKYILINYFMNYDSYSEETYTEFNIYNIIQKSFENHFKQAMIDCEQTNMNLQIIVLLFDKYWIKMDYFDDYFFNYIKKIKRNISADFYIKITNNHNYIMNFYLEMLYKISFGLNKILIKNFEIFDMKVKYEVYTPELESAIEKRKRENIENSMVNALVSFKKHKIYNK